MFTGLSAFPITPFSNEEIDYSAFERLMSNLVSAEVDSICAMGSTGLYPYLSREELGRVAKVAVDNANGIPIMVGVGALRTKDVLKNVEVAQQAGVNALLLAPVSYQPLNEEEVFTLYEAVSRETSVPICVYENPRVTNFTFGDALYERIAQLPHIGAIKIPGMPFATTADNTNQEGAARLATLRAIVPKHVAIGVSGDSFGSAGMAQGCDLWLSVLGGTFPKTVMQLIELAQSENSSEAAAMSASLNRIWALFSKNGGGIRVVAAAAAILGYCERENLPAPLLPISKADFKELEGLIESLSLA